jgi:hypothetical protein
MSLLYIFAINLHFKFYLVNKIIFYLLFFIPFLSMAQPADKMETRKVKAARDDARIKKMQKDAEQGACNMEDIAMEW